MCFDIEPAFVFQGKLVFANQGKPSDYQLLNQTLDLAGTIAIVRYGGEGRAGKVSPCYRLVPHPRHLQHLCSYIVITGLSDLKNETIVMQ